jgi:hypothetical protein
LVVYSYEQRRMEATFKGRQESYKVVEPMMMMTEVKIKFTSGNLCYEVNMIGIPPYQITWKSTEWFKSY